MTIDITAPVEDFKTNLQTSIEPIKISTSFFESSLLTASNAANDFTNILATAADKISKLDFTEPQPKISSTMKFGLPNQEFNTDITRQITELIQITGEIARKVENKRSPSVQNEITVSPTITINLSGAYVFDNQMKDRLTQDITTNVANSITDIVTLKTNNLQI